MNQTTKETRRESYEAVLPKVKDRARLILETLGDKEMTVSEITEELVSSGKIPYFNRNYVAPRLTELKDMGVVRPAAAKRPPDRTPPRPSGAASTRKGGTEPWQNRTRSSSAVSHIDGSKEWIAPSSLTTSRRST